MAWNSLGPSPSAIASASTNAGKAITTSSIRITTESRQPPHIPAIAPIPPPRIRPIALTASAISSDARPP